MRVKISLVEFGDEKVYPVEQLKNWFPKGKFDKRYPQEYVNKWLNKNKRYLEFLGISYKWDEDNKSLILIPGNKIGLAPLRNPYGGQIYGSIVVRPRLGWLKIYQILYLIEWKYQPTFLKDEEPIFSDGVLPRWFKAVETLRTISKALNLYMKGICRRETSSKVPIGSVNWDEYATKSVPYGEYDCFSINITDYSHDLEVHRQFKGVVREIAKDISSPNVPIKVRNEGNSLIANIEKNLEHVSYENPSVEKLKKIKVPSFYRVYYEKAIQKSIEYLDESKFSIEFGNFYGLPYAIEMDRLFEYWVEYWAFNFAKRIGARFFSDIKRNSRIRFYNFGNWKSLKELRPDVIIEKGSKTLIIEVKYKKHLAYLQYGKYSTEILEEHRHDIHQLLAYMSTCQSEKRIGCLVYPYINNEISHQMATLINYTNIKVNVDVILCSIPFHEEKPINIFEDIWSNKYASFA